MSSSTTLRIAALGDVHGHMHAARKLVTQHARRHGAFDALLQVGDFEPHRHADDLRSMDAPSKYKSPGEYADFHAGRASFPSPLYFIGGNHEPYGWLEHHPEGFALTPDIHYLGRAGSRRIIGLNIVYLSGIYVEDRFLDKRPDVATFARTSNKAWIAFNHLDLDHILATALPHVDILIVHDWPADTLQPQDNHLFARRGRTLHSSPGNAYARVLVELLEPRLVFCGHMHTRYHRTLNHKSGQKTDIFALGHIQHGEDAIIAINYNAMSKEFDLTS